MQNPVATFVVIQNQSWVGVCRMETSVKLQWKMSGKCQGNLQEIFRGISGYLNKKTKVIFYGNTAIEERITNIQQRSGIL